MKKVVIQVSGGVVQSISTNIENLDCRVIDWDEINNISFDDKEEQDFQYFVDVTSEYLLDYSVELANKVIKKNNGE